MTRKNTSYEFKCGCISTRYNEVVTKHAIHKVCKIHAKRVAFIERSCIDCGGRFRGSVSNISRQKRCNTCIKAVRAKRAKEYKEEHPWTTADECKLIRRMSPETARKYLPAIKCHVEWPGFNRKMCVAACKQQAGF